MDTVRIIVALIILWCLLVVAAIVIIKVAYRQIKTEIVKKESDFRKQLIEDNRTIISNIKKDLKTVNSTNEYRPIIEVDLLSNTFMKLKNSIIEDCAIAMNKTGALRLAVYLFHNGSSSTQGLQFFKMSCICEKVAVGSGVRERSIEQSNIPINLFDDMIDCLITNGKYVIMNNEELENTNHNIFISTNRVKYAQAISLFDINNNILGFVLIEMGHDYDRDLAMREKDKVDILANKLAPILSYAQYSEIAAKPTEEDTEELITNKVQHES